jgi:hypothetical protein
MEYWRSRLNREKIMAEPFLRLNESSFFGTWGNVYQVVNYSKNILVTSDHPSKKQDKSGFGTGYQE